MKHDFILPSGVLDNHIAVLGKTGSGKTSTAKLIVEHVVAQEFRVCVLDTVKSDWWGLTSSRDGKHAGLDFKILGGPRGHVPLHSNAGKVIGQLVGSAKLQHSIIDMADFEAGGIQKFFVDFAPSLMRNMKGVLYLVIEEAHELAPKERAGFGQENMAIHFAKKLATAGRSKGIRLIVATQSVQQLHNRVLGSAETLIAHRLTAPADQEPVIKWLKANTEKDTALKIASEMSSVSTGTGWVCSGEVKFFEKVKFPKFATYDNTATPTGDLAAREIKTTPVDQDELKAIIGDAVEEALANDPAKLRHEIAQLKQKLIKAESVKPVALPAPAPEKIFVVRDADMDTVRTAIKQCETATDTLNANVTAVWKLREQLQSVLSGMKNFFKPLSRPHQPMTHPPTKATTFTSSKFREQMPAGTRIVETLGVDGKLSKCERAILTSLAQYPHGRTANQVAVLTGYSGNSGGFNNSLSKLRSSEFIGRGQPIQITDAGLSALGEWQPLPTGEDLQAHWLNRLSKCESAILQYLLGEYPEGRTSEEVAANTGYEKNSGGFNNSLSRLRTLELITRGQPMKASDDFFQ